MNSVFKVSWVENVWADWIHSFSFSNCSVLINLCESLIPNTLGVRWGYTVDQSQKTIHTRTPPRCDLAWPIHLLAYVWEETRVPEKTHKDMGTTCNTPHRQQPNWPPKEIHRLLYNSPDVQWRSKLENSWFCS